jgi:hypothetical protein
METSASHCAIIIGFDRKPTEPDLSAIRQEGGIRGEESLLTMQRTIPVEIKTTISEAFDSAPGSFPPMLVGEFRRQLKAPWANSGFAAPEPGRIAVMSFKARDAALFLVAAYTSDAELARALRG